MLGVFLFASLDLIFLRRKDWMVGRRNLAKVKERKEKAAKGKDKLGN